MTPTAPRPKPRNTSKNPSGVPGKPRSVSICFKATGGRGPHGDIAGENQQPIRNFKTRTIVSEARLDLHSGRQFVHFESLGQLLFTRTMPNHAIRRQRRPPNRVFEPYAMFWT